MTTDTTTRRARIAAGLVGLLALIGSFLVVPGTAQAASGYQGYAAYRDGVLFNYTWHAAMMDDPYSNTTSLPVIHQPGSGYVQWGTWSQFLANNTFRGYYRPKVQPSSSTRDSFKYMARRLKDEAITYSGVHQVDSAVWGIGTWVDPYDVVSMRCDGVVEYIFEWYGYRVYGSDTQWDVTRANDYWIWYYHGFNYVNPKTQAQNFLTRVW